jgi:hypothetical protein
LVGDLEGAVRRRLEGLAGGITTLWLPPLRPCLT